MRRIIGGALLIISFYIFQSVLSTTTSDEKTMRLFLEESANKKECFLQTIKITTPDRIYSLELKETKQEILSANTVLILDDQPSAQLDTNDLCSYQLEDQDQFENLDVELFSEKNELRGSVSIDNLTFDLVPTLITQKSTEIKLKRHISKKNGGICGEAIPPSFEKDNRISHTLLRTERSASFHMTDWQKRNYYVEVFIVVDNQLYKSLGSSVSATTNNIIEVINHVSAYYRQFRIHVVLVGLEIWSNTQKINLTRDSDEALARFSYYRRVNIKVKHDNAQLLTSQEFDNNYAGKAWISGMCLYTLSTGLSTTHYSENALETASILAHEMGHNFGLNHDTEFCSCYPDIACLMAAGTAPAYPVKWSNCSISSLNNNLLTGLSHCLNDKPEFVTSDKPNAHPACGNAIIDAGEECDPGLRPISTMCCNPTTCKLQPNAECASGSCCNTTTCKLRPAGALCSTDDSTTAECDFPEYCDGLSELCPNDTYPADATKQCENSAGDYCYKKTCGSRKAMCKKFFGPLYTEARDLCFSQNSVDWGDQQNQYGYCFYEVASQTQDLVTFNYTICQSQDYMCGSIHCSDSRDESSPLDRDSINWPSLTYFTLRSGDEFYCHHPRVHIQLTGIRDPGLSPDGSGCDTNKICVNSFCRAIEDVRNVTCSCLNGGICNNFGSCQCPAGFRGPTCGASCPSCCGGSEHANYCYQSTNVEAATTSSPIEGTTIPQTVESTTVTQAPGTTSSPIDGTSIPQTVESTTVTQAPGTTSSDSSNVVTTTSPSSTKPSFSECASQTLCQNGGQCLSNSVEVCKCSVGFIGLYCQTARQKVIKSRMKTNQFNYTAELQDKQSEKHKIVAEKFAKSITSVVSSVYPNSNSKATITGLSAGSVVADFVLELAVNSGSPPSNLALGSSINQYCQSNPNSSSCSYVTPTSNGNYITNPENVDICSNSDLHYCSMHATCQQFGDSGYTCQCKSGFRDSSTSNDTSTQGKVCTEICGSVSCLNDGVCEEQTDSTKKCSCRNGYRGDRCETAPDNFIIIIAICSAIGGLLLIIGIIVLVVCITKRRKTRHQTVNIIAKRSTPQGPIKVISSADLAPPANPYHRGQYNAAFETSNPNLSTFGRTPQQPASNPKFSLGREGRYSPNVYTYT